MSAGTFPVGSSTSGESPRDASQTTTILRGTRRRIWSTWIQCVIDLGAAWVHAASPGLIWECSSPKTGDSPEVWGFLQVRSVVWSPELILLSEHYNLILPIFCVCLNGDVIFPKSLRNPKAKVLDLYFIFSLFIDNLYLGYTLCLL